MSSSVFSPVYIAYLTDVVSCGYRGIFLHSGVAIERHFDGTSGNVLCHFLSSQSFLGCTVHGVLNSLYLKVNIWGILVT